MVRKTSGVRELAMTTHVPLRVAWMEVDFLVLAIAAPTTYDLQTWTLRSGLAFCRAHFRRTRNGGSRTWQRWPQ